MNAIERRKGGDRRKLSGAQRAATLLIVLGKESATRVLQHLGKDEVLEIARSASTLGIVDRASLEDMIEEFSHALAAGADVVGSLAEAQQLAAGALAPEDVATLGADEVEDAARDVWHDLAQCADERIGDLVSEEPPCIIASIIRRLESARASAILSRLAADIRRETIACMLTPDCSPGLFRQFLEEALSLRIASDAAGGLRDDGARRVADVVNRLSSDAVDDVLSYLGAVAPDLAAGVRALVFKFDEVGNLASEDRAMLFDAIPTEKVILALKGAAPQTVEAVLGSLGARARRMVEAELSNDDKAPEREIQAARRAIVENALRLSETGAIRLPQNPEPG